MKAPFHDMLALGAAREEMAERLMVADGWDVIRLKDIARRDHRGQHVDGRDDVALPDFEIAKHGIRLAVEWKAKREISLGRLTGEFEHGIDRTSWEGLRRYEDRTGVPVYLALIAAICL